MRTALLYRTKYGTSAEYARLITETLPGETVLFDLGKERNPDLSGFDAVIIGGSIFAGTLIRGIRNYCERARAELLARKVGLFITCLYSGEKAEGQLAAAYPEWLYVHACGKASFGGRIVFADLKPFDRFLFKMVAKTSEDTSRFDGDAARRFAERFAESAGIT